MEYQRVGKLCFLCRRFFNAAFAACSLNERRAVWLVGIGWLAFNGWGPAALVPDLNDENLPDKGTPCDMYLAFAGFLAFAFACTALTAHQRERSGKTSQRTREIVTQGTLGRGDFLFDAPEWGSTCKNGSSWHLSQSQSQSSPFLPLQEAPNCWYSAQVALILRSNRPYPS